MRASRFAPVAPFSPRRHGRTFLLPALLLLGAAAACGRSGEPPAGAGPAGGRGAMPAMPVEVLTLETKPVEQMTEFIGTIKSRHSITMQPQVEGFITRIAVQSGDRVSGGTVLMEIDAASQEAAVSALESTRAAREADAAYARQQAQRAKALVEVGAGSAQEAEQAAAALQAAEAQLKAADDQIRQQKNELSYYKVTAPSAGVVGDIPVRVGDRVTRTTVLTTIDDNAALELYLNIPVQQASMLHVGLPARVLDPSGESAVTEKITFVAPSVDDATQTVLAKAALTDRSHTWRADQVARAQVIWRTEPGLTVPIVSVMRINGQYFVFVAEDTAQGTVARQKAVTLGPVTGNDYLVRDGLKPGDQLIVSGVQKIGDGMPVRAGGPGDRSGAPGAAGSRGAGTGRQ
jgi:RND family efflux transporter MFP subunit